MGAVTKKDIPEISEFMTEFWRLIKATWVVEEKDEYWNDTIRKFTELDNQYQHPFCHKQILAYLDYLDKKLRDEKENA